MPISLPGTISWGRSIPSDINPFVEGSMQEGRNTFKLFTFVSLYHISSCRSKTRAYLSGHQYGDSTRDIAIVGLGLAQHTKAIATSE